MKFSKVLRAAGVLVVVSAALLLTAHGEDTASPIKPPNLGGADRYLTFVSTDKPIYRLGETLYVRAAVLHANKHTPANDANPAVVEATGPKGDTVASGMVNP